MKKVSIVLAVIYVGLLVAAQANVIINSSFENGDGTLAGISDWSKWNDTSGELNTGWGQTYDGDDMVRLWWDSGLYQNFSVTPGWDYDVSVQTRTESFDQLQGGVQGNVSLEWYDSGSQKIGGNAYDYQFTSAQGDGAWVEAAGSATAPANAASGRLVVYVSNTGTGSGSAWFDSATVTAIPEPLSIGLLGLGLLMTWYVRKNR